MNRPADYPRPYRFVRPMAGEDMARAVGDADAAFVRKVRPPPPEIIRKAELADARLNAPGVRVEPDGLSAMPSARAFVLRIQSLRLFTLRASIAIAVFLALYFAGQFVRGVL